MENLFKKYENYIGELKQENYWLKNKITELEKTRAEPKGDFSYEGSVIRQYYYFTKDMLARKGVNSFFAPGLYFKLLRKTALLPFKLSYHSAKYLNNKIAPKNSYNALSLFLYEQKIALAKGINLLPVQKKRYKVGIFIPTLNALAGAERYTLSIAKCIENAYTDVDIDLIGTNIFSDKPSLYDLPTIEEIKKKFHIELKHTNFRLLILQYEGEQNLWLNNFRQVAEISKGYDLFINCQHNLYHTRSNKSLFICHFPHKPLVSLNMSISKTLQNHISNTYTKSYDVYLANSEFTASWIKKYWPGINNRRIDILYPPVLKKADRPAKLPSKENIILICSRIDPEKKILELATMFAENKNKFPGYKLYIAGSTYANDQYLQSYFQKITTLAKQNPAIQLYPNVSFTELIELYKKAKVYWHGMGYLEDIEENPIRTEHFGMTVIEAMTYGCVPVVHNSGGPSMLVKKLNLDTCWKTEEEAIEKLEWITRNKEYDAISKKVIEASLEFSVEMFEYNLLRVLKNKHLIPKRLLK